MKWVTHVLCTLCAIYILSFFIPISMVDVFLAVFASIFPDYLEMAAGIKHRNILVHNFALALGLFAASCFLPIFGFAFGYFYHLFLDSFTVYGVWFFNKRIRGFLYSKSLFENIAVILAHYFIFCWLFFGK